jgi:aspartyl-tRNA(Asn)/glutamyl-tRNA(Gln) amidotransferase subunit A
LIINRHHRPALKIGVTENEVMFGEKQDMLVEPSSIAGLTGISITCGLINGLPFGFGLSGPQFSEEKLLATAHQYQINTNWHYAKPTL